MSLVAVKPGGWDEEEVLRSDDLNALQAEMLKAIDGTGGGFYTLIADLELDGAAVTLHNAIFEVARVEGGGSLTVAGGSTFALEGDGEISGDVDLTGLVNIADECHVQAGALLRIDGGGFLTAAATSIVTIGGTFTIQSGAAVTIASTAVDLSGIFNVVSGGRVDVEDGGLLAITSRASLGSAMTVGNNARIALSAGAEIQVAAPDDLVINAASFDFRVTLTPAAMTKGGGVDDFQPPAAALPIWLQHGTSGPPEISFAVPFMPGDTITTLRLWLNGSYGGPGHSLAPGMPKFLLYKLSATGIATLLCELFDPVNTLPAYDSSHTITLSSGAPGSLLPYVVQPGELLLAVIRGEAGVNAVPDTTAYTSIDGTGLARHYRNTSEVN